MTDRQQIFDRIKQSAAYANRASRTLPSAMGSYLGAGCAIVVGSVVCLCALTGTIVLIGAGTYLHGKANEVPFLACVGIVPALITVGSITALTAIIRRIIQFSKTQTHAAPAIVVSKHSRGSGQYVTNYILFEFEDGQRQEYQIGYEKEAALVGMGDAGVAFTWLDVFLAFDRVP